jgi:hypothetical protein
MAFDLAMDVENLARQWSHSRADGAVVVTQTGVDPASRIAKAALVKTRNAAGLDSKFAIDQDGVDRARRARVDKLANSTIQRHEARIIELYQNKVGPQSGPY